MLGHVLNAIFWFIKTTQNTKYIYYTTDPLEFYKLYKVRVPCPLDGHHHDKNIRELDVS